MSNTNPKMEDYLLNEIKEYLKSRKDVAFAFLYGSYSKGSATSLSDVDIIVNSSIDISKIVLSSENITI